MRVCSVFADFADLLVRCAMSHPQQKSALALLLWTLQSPWNRGILDIGCCLFLTQDDGINVMEDDATLEDETDDEDEHNDREEEEEEEEEEEKEEEEEGQRVGDPSPDPPDDSEFIEVSFVMTNSPIRPKTCKRQRVPRFANGRTYKGTKAVLPECSSASHQWSACHAARVYHLHSMTAIGVAPTSYVTA